MACRSRDLSVLAFANGFTLWHYTTADPAADVAAAGYFGDAADMVCVGDIIIANMDTEGEPVAGIFLVASTSGAVCVTDLTAIQPVREAA